MKKLILPFLLFLSFCGFGQQTQVEETLDSLGNIFSTHYHSFQFQKALEVSILTEKIIIDNYSKESEQYIGFYQNQGALYHRMGEHLKAEKKLNEALLIHENLPSSDINKKYGLLVNLGNLYIDMGKLKEAKSMLKEVMEYRKSQYGRINIRYCGDLVNYAKACGILGEKEKQEELLIEAKHIIEDELKETEHLFYLNCLNNLAGCYLELEEYEKCEPIILEVVEIVSEEVGEQHPKYAFFLGNLASMYGAMGQHEKSIALLLKAMNIWEKSMGKEHEHYGVLLYNTSRNYSELGKKELSLKYGEEYLSLEKSMNDAENVSYANGLNNVAMLHSHFGNYSMAESLLLEAINIEKESRSTDNYTFCGLLVNLGNQYLLMEEYKKSEKYFLEAKKILEERIKMPRSMYYHKCLESLSKLYAKTERTREAIDLSHELSTLLKSKAEETLLYQSERERQRFLKRYDYSQNQIFTFAHHYTNEKIERICFDNALFHKGFLINAAERINHISKAEPSTRKILDELKSCQRRLAKEYTKPLAERDIVLLAELEKIANSIEKKLTRTVADFSEAFQQIKWQDVQEKLDSNEAAIEFVNFTDFENSGDNGACYAALVLTKKSKNPKYIPLFNEADLTKLLFGKDKTKQIASVYDEKKITELIWQPLASEFTDVQTIYFSPSGLLHRINLNALPIDEKTSLADTYKLIQLNSTRQLTSQIEINNNKNDAILFGGINYEFDTTAIFTENKSNHKTASRGILDFSQSDSLRRNGKWEFLDWTEVEISAIESILASNEFDVEINRGYMASEESLKSIPSPSPHILHIATHGFFFPDPNIVDSKQKKIDGEPVFRSSDNPMIRSGLIMAGGNHAWKTGKPYKPNMEDGVLTAYEISQMDLSSTELVVLSACETGLGDIDGNEGVYGLQRAFKIAGAKYIIMSLWQVPDYPTQQLMTIFYNNWLSKKMDVPDAFRAAQSEMKKRFDDPFMWAGFVLVE